MKQKREESAPVPFATRVAKDFSHTKETHRESKSKRSTADDMLILESSTGRWTADCRLEGPERDGEKIKVG